MLAAATALAAASAAAAPAGKLPVQLCACDPAHAASQQWTWGQRRADAAHPGAATTPEPLRLKAHPNLCLFDGWGKKPTYLYVDECSAGTPPKLSFRSEHNPGLVRDHAVLTDGLGCVDADGMSSNLQLYHCLPDDDDQQYAGIDGYGLIVDRWTGFSNCVGVVNGSSCAPPAGASSSPPHPPAPAPAGVPSTYMSPRYHLNDGPYRQSDPSGCIEVPPPLPSAPAALRLSPEAAEADPPCRLADQWHVVCVP